MYRVCTYVFLTDRKHSLANNYQQNMKSQPEGVFLVLTFASAELVPFNFHFKSIRKIGLHIHR
jgi:hypothetical protein